MKTISIFSLKTFKILIILSVLLVPNCFLFMFTPFPFDQIRWAQEHYISGDIPRAITGFGFVIAPISISIFTAAVLGRIFFFKDERSWRMFVKAMFVMYGTGFIILAPFPFMSSGIYKNSREDFITNKQKTENIVGEEKIIAPSGSAWALVGGMAKKASDQLDDDYYFHVVGPGESLEYIFNDMETSVQTAKDQGYGIGVREKGVYRDVLLDSVMILFKQGIFMYSNLEPGDTVYLRKSQLKAMQ